jgi:hypothetical protein
MFMLGVVFKCSVDTPSQRAQGSHAGSGTWPSGGSAPDRGLEGIYHRQRGGRARNGEHSNDRSMRLAHEPRAKVANGA